MDTLIKLMDEKFHDDSNNYVEYSKKLIEKELERHKTIQLKLKFINDFENRNNEYHLLKDEPGGTWAKTVEMAQYINKPHPINTLKNWIEQRKKGYLKSLELEKDIASKTNDIPLEPEVLKKAGPKIMLLDKLGIIDYINESQRLDNNFAKIGKILEPIITERWDTTRKIIDAIKKPHERNSRNNPKKNDKNVELVDRILGDLGVSEPPPA